MPDLRRFTRTALSSLGLGAVFVAGATASLVASLDHPAARRLIARHVTGGLATSFAGSLVIDRIDHLALLDGRVGGVEAHAADADGQTILVVHGLSARISLAPLLASLPGSGPIQLVLTEVRVDQVEGSLREDATGEISLATAFLPRNPSPPGGPPGREVDLAIERIVIGHAAARGLVASHPVDADADAIEGVFRVGTAGLSASVRRFPFRARALPIPAGAAAGSAEGEVRLPAGAGALHLQAAVEAQAGGLVASGAATLDGKRLVAHLLVPRVPGEALAAVVAGSPIRAPVGLTADLAGELSALQGSARVLVGEGIVDLAGALRRGERLDAELTATIARLALQDLAPSAPAGLVDGGAQATLSIGADGALAVRYSARTAPTMIAGQDVPAVVTSGSFDGVRLAGSAQISEPGAPTQVTYSLAPEPGRPGVRGLDLDVQTEAASLARVARIGGVIGGRGALHARGHLTLDDALTVDASASVRAQGVQRGADHAAEVGVDARVRGSLTAPTIQASAFARGVRAAGQQIARVSLVASGTRDAAQVSLDARGAGGDTATASARLALGGAVEVRDLRARVVHRGELVSATARAVQVRGGGVEVEGLVVRGAGGELRASVQAGRGSLRVKAQGADLQLARVATLAGGEPGALAGVASIDVDLRTSAAGATGFVRLSGRGLDAGEIHGGSVDLRSTFAGRQVAVQLGGEVPDLGSFSLETSDGRVNGSLLDLASLTAATGALKIEVSAADLSRIAALLPAGSLPVARLAGAATIAATASRAGAGPPAISASVTTRDLLVQLPDRGATPGLQFKGIDLDLRGTYEASRGLVVLDLGGQDERGLLAAIHAEGAPPIAALVREPGRRRELLLGLPLVVRATLPRRAIADLPPAVRVAGVGGDLSLELTASGTARDPRVHVTAESHGLEKKQEGVTSSTPIDVRVDGDFASSRGDATLGVSVAGRTLLTAKVDGGLTVGDLIEDREGGPRWSAGAEITLLALPLRLLSAALNQPIGGCASGTVTLRGLHEDAAVDAKVRVAGLRIGAVNYRDATFSAQAGGGRAEVEARIDQGDGLLRATGRVGLAWGGEIVPRLDRAGTADLALEARAFRLSAARPFVRDTLGNVDGLLDADLRYRIEAGDALHGQMQGKLTVRDGVVDAAMLGQEFRAIQGTVTASPGGEIRLSDASARGISGRATLDGVAHLDGWQLRDASAALRIARRETLVLTYQGVEIGQAWGDLDLAAKTDASGALTLDVAVPRFDLELPDSSSRSAQSLDDDPTVQVGTRADGRFVELPLRKPDPPPDSPPDGPAAPPVNAGVTVRVALGREVRVHHANLVDLWLTGGLQAAVAGGRTGVSGVVHVDRGFIEIQGRKFDIEQATASFDPARPPADPTIRATASYQAPESTRILADFSGTASAGKLTLRSEPALSQSELLSLIVFGSRDGAVTAYQNTSNPNNAVRAASLGGGVLTQGLNKAISEITPVDVTTRVDTSDGQNPRPEIGVALSRKVSASVSYRLGLATPGQNPDRATLRLAYRFLPRWSLETSVGDAGTSIIDVLWKLRY